jgi:hypothetical protein
MFGKNQDNQAENDQTASLPKAATLPDGAEIAVHPQPASMQSEMTACISSNTTVVGKIVVDGSVMRIVPPLGQPSRVHESFVNGVPQLVGAKLVKLGNKPAFEPVSLPVGQPADDNLFLYICA